MTIIYFLDLLFFVYFYISALLLLLLFWSLVLAACQIGDKSSSAHTSRNSKDGGGCCCYLCLLLYIFEICFCCVSKYYAHDFCLPATRRYSRLFVFLLLLLSFALLLFTLCQLTYDSSIAQCRLTFRKSSRHALLRVRVVKIDI